MVVQPCQPSSSPTHTALFLLPQKSLLSLNSSCYVMRAVRASQILQLGKPTADLVSDSHSLKGAAREGSMWDVCRLILLSQPWFNTWQVAETQQQGDMQLSIIFLLMANIRWLSAIQSPALCFPGYLLTPCSFLLGLIPWMGLAWFADVGPRGQYNPGLHVPALLPLPKWLMWL